MDCDQVFAVLTRGPTDGSEPEQRGVVQHLVTCESCRQLAEALRPAPEADHESLSVEEELTLPAYHGGAIATARTTAPARVATGRQPPRLYRRGLSPPARRTWTAGKLAQDNAPPAHVEERAGTLEWLVAICLLGVSAAAMLTLIVWGAIGLAGWL